MTQLENIINGYDSVADDYTKHFLNELEKKHFDRLLLSAFTHETLSKGKLIDLGCGPGQATGFIHDCGLTDIMGVDISINMILNAKKHYPKLEFQVGDILDLHFEDNSFGSAIALYSMIHFDVDELKVAFKETFRILKP